MNRFATASCRTPSLTIAALALSAVGLQGGCPQDPFTVDDIFLRPSVEVKGTPAQYGYRYDELTVPIEGDRYVSIWHVRADNPKGIVVIIPGSDRNKSRYLIGLPVFVPAGYDTILMDYEGFGASPGEHLLQNLLDDGMAVVDYALTQHPRVFAFGISTGASPAVQAAKHRDLAGLMLEASLVLRDEPELYLKYLGIDVQLFWDVANAFMHPQIPDGFDILKHIPDVTEHKLILHSTEDDVTTWEAGVRVFAAANEPKEFFEERGEHGKMIEIETELYRTTVTGWLDRRIAALNAAQPSPPPTTLGPIDGDSVR